MSIFFPAPPFVTSRMAGKPSNPKLAASWILQQLLEPMYPMGAVAKKRVPSKGAVAKIDDRGTTFWNPVGDSCKTAASLLAIQLYINF